LPADKPGVIGRSIRHFGDAPKRRGCSIEGGLQLKLDSRLEELRPTLKLKAVQISVPVDHFEADIVGHMPVDHRRDSPELAAPQCAAVEINV